MLVNQPSWDWCAAQIYAFLGQLGDFHFWIASCYRVAIKVLSNIILLGPKAHSSGYVGRGSKARPVYNWWNLCALRNYKTTAIYVCRHSHIPASAGFWLKHCSNSNTLKQLLLQATLFTRNGLGWTQLLLSCRNCLNKTYSA